MRNRRKPQYSEADETKIYQKSDVSAKKRRPWAKVLGVSLLAFTLFTSGLLYGFYRWTTRPSEDLIPVDYEEQDRVNILVLGVDGGVNGNGLPATPSAYARSDVIMLLSMDLKAKDVGILSIPRDTRVYIPTRGTYEKVAHAHAYGGAELAKATIESFLDVPIHHWVRVDFKAFVKAVDTLEGVPIDVPRDMDYEDPDQDLFIHIKKGPQTLSGAKALEFVRYRDRFDGDIGRIAAQELFLKALMEQAVKLSTVAKIPELVSEVIPYLATDLNTQDILYLVNQSLKLKVENVKMGMIPGVGQDITEDGHTLNYWLADMVAAKPLIDELILGLNPALLGEINLCVQNGMGVQGAADALSSILRSVGFNVVEVGNADNMNYETTMVFAAEKDRNAQIATVKALINYCPKVEAYEKEDLPQGVDVLVIMGKDYIRPGA